MGDLDVRLPFVKAVADLVFPVSCAGRRLSVKATLRLAASVVLCFLHPHLTTDTPTLNPAPPCYSIFCPSERRDETSLNLELDWNGWQQPLVGGMSRPLWAGEGPSVFFFLFSFFFNFHIIRGLTTFAPAAISLANTRIQSTTPARHKAPGSIFKACL